MDNGAQAMPLFDQIIFLILCPITIICCSFIIITFVVYPSTRKIPGDLLLGLSIANMMISISFLSNAIYSSIHKHAPASDGAYCQISALMLLSATTADFTYNIAFCIYLYYSITNVLKLKRKLKLLIHSFSFIGMIGFPLINYFIGQTGLNIEMICSISEGSAFPYFRSLLLVIMMVVSLTTLSFMKSRIPNQQQFLVYKEAFYAYYLKYVMVMSITCLLSIVSLIIEELNHRYFNEYGITVFTSVTNLSRMAQPILLTIVRGNDPLIKEKLQRIYAIIFRQYVAPTMSSNSENWLSLLSKDLKSSFIVTILHGIMELSKKERNRISSRTSNNKQTRMSKLGLEQLSNHNICEADLYELTKIHIDSNEKYLGMTVTQYAPKLFETLQQRDSMMINICESFDLEANIQQISTFKGPEGGKSGEFFFFSNDNKLILKTISNQELKTIQSRLQFYAEHVLSPELSMLSLIYGVYSFERDDVCEIGATNIILQRNISQSPSEYILRTYDLKGSQFDRETNIKGNISQLTLKDKNFVELEQSIKINYEESKYIKGILNRDVEFLSSMNLMDYSLLVVMVDWQTYRFNQSVSIKEIQNQFSNPYQMIASCEQFGIYYHIGMIDYLQEWNTLKKVEEASKKVVYGNVDTSATHPIQYGQRFKDKVIEQFFI